MREEYLWQKCGPIIQEGLQDENIFEIMLNPDHQLWFKHKTKGNIHVGEMNESASSNFVHALAQYEHKFLNQKTPYLDATLPFAGERVNVTIPPVTQNVSFNIRKKAKLVFTLQDYVQVKIITRSCIAVSFGRSTI
jgi:type IV secretion system protein TrbB